MYLRDKNDVYTIEYEYIIVYRERQTGHKGISELETVIDWLKRLSVRLNQQASIFKVLTVDIWKLTEFSNNKNYSGGWEVWVKPL